MTSAARRGSWSPAALAPIAALVALVACGPTLPVPSGNYQTGNRLVFPVVAAGPATMDGQANEAAWTSGFTFNMEDGAPSFPAATFRGVADANAIYIHVKVDDSDFNDADVVVIGLNPDNTNANYRRIHIFPCTPTGSCPATGAGTASAVYWTGNLAGGTYTWTSAPAAAAGIVHGSHTFTDAGNPSNKWWEVEVKIPRGAPFNFVNTNFFGLFVDVARTDPDVGIAGEAVQYTWPPNHFIGGASENDILTDLESGTLQPSAWGNATLSAALGNGVRISSSDIRSNHPTDPTLIRLDAGNVFTAEPANYTSTGGTLVGAQAVTATFKIANNGLPLLGSFANVPVPGNPAGPADIAPAATHVYTTGTWNLTPAQVTDYTAHPAQCIRVELSSTNVNTVFIQPSAMVNMHFVQSMSPIRDTALITTKGIEPRPGERQLAFTLRERFVNFDSKLTWTTKIDNATPVPNRALLYRADASPGQEHALGITIEPPRMTIPNEVVRVPIGAGGKERPPVRLEVRADELLTFISSGAIQINGQSVTAAGLPMKERRGEPKLKGDHINRIGAVIGSFDEFKETAFVIGNASTIKVPSGASALHLKINDAADQYGNQKGEGFNFQVVRTRVEPWMSAVNPHVQRPVRGDDVFVTLGANLPTWMLRGERDTGRFVRIGKKTFRAYEPVGSFGFIVRMIR